MALLPKHKKCIQVALSGGKDSMALVHCLLILQKKKALPFSLAIIHVDHGLREQSKEDVVFLKKFASAHNITLQVHSLSWQEGEAKNQACYREKRYEIFSRYKEHSILALAHHMGDQAETFLQRLFRGTGLQGLACMQAWDTDRSLWRPLLEVEPKHIEELVRKERIAFREDHTNESLQYERNWMRKKIIPLLEEKRPGLVKRLAGLADEVSQFSFNSNKIKPIPLGSHLTLYRQSELLQATSYDLVKLFSCQRKHVLSLQELLQKTKGELFLPHGVCLLSQSWLLYSKEKEASLFLPVLAPSKEWESVLGFWEGEGDWKPSLRPRYKGDGAKIKRSLQEARIPSFFRGAIPVLEEEGEKKLLLPPNMERTYTWEFPKGRVRYKPSTLSSQLSSD